MSAVIIKSTIPAEMVVLSEQTMVEVSRLTQSAGIVITDVNALAVGNQVYTDIDKLAKAISAQRLEMTRPLDAVKALAMDAERQATGPLLKAKEELGRRLAEFAKAEKARLAEIERRQREEAERVAAEQRAKAEAERQRIIAEQAAARAEEEARRKEEADMFGAEPEPVPMPEPPPIQVVLPIIEPPKTVVSAPAPKSAARITERERVIITDAAAIIAEACKDGGKLFGKLVVTLDEKAIAELVMAGVVIKGAAIEKYETVGSNGGRR